MSGQNPFRARGTLENQSSVAFCSGPSLTLNELQRGLALDRGWMGGGRGEGGGEVFGGTALAPSLYM